MKGISAILFIILCTVVPDLLPAQRYIPGQRGERDPLKLANPADSRCKTPTETIAKSLSGNWNEDLLFALKQSFDLCQFIRNRIRECEQKMESLFEQYSSSFPPESREVLRSKKQVQKKTEWRLMLKSTVIRSLV